MQVKRRVGGVVGMRAADKFWGRHCVVGQQQPLRGKVVCLPLRGPRGGLAGRVPRSRLVCMGGV